MPLKITKTIKTLDDIINICTYWKKQILGKTEEGKEILEEFKEESVIEVLSDYV